MASSGGLRGLLPAKFSGVDVVKTRIDYSTATINYIGIAAPGARMVDAVWQIKRLTLDASGRTTAIEFARDGDKESSSAIFQWSERANYSYGALE